jgi:hypothetical protein
VNACYVFCERKADGKMFQKLHFCHALLGGVAYRPPMKVGAFDGFMGRRCGVAKMPPNATKGWR